MTFEYLFGHLGMIMTFHNSRNWFFKGNWQLEGIGYFEDDILVITDSIGDDKCISIGHSGFELIGEQLKETGQTYDLDDDTSLHNFSISLMLTQLSSSLSSMSHSSGSHSFPLLSSTEVSESLALSLSLSCSWIEDLTDFLLHRFGWSTTCNVRKKEQFEKTNKLIQCLGLKQTNLKMFWQLNIRTSFVN